MTTSQNARILAYLKSGRTITSLEAFAKFECTRLAARIRDLKDSGHAIARDMVEVQSGKWVAKYRLVPNG